MRVLHGSSIAGVLGLALLVSASPAAADDPKEWTPLGGLYEGNVGGFVEDVAGSIWATTSGNGIFKSADGGNTWVAVNDGLTCWNVSGLAVSPKTGDLFASASGRNGGAFKLDKDGKTWQAQQGDSQAMA